jgi:hypothetical protein
MPTLGAAGSWTSKGTSLLDYKRAFNGDCAITTFTGKGVTYEKS